MEGTAKVALAHANPASNSVNVMHNTRTHQVPLVECLAHCRQEVSVADRVQSRLAEEVLVVGQVPQANDAVRTQLLRLPCLGQGWLASDGMHLLVNQVVDLVSNSEQQYLSTQ